MASHAECGFPSPADGYLDRLIDFNEMLIENSAATFAAHIADGGRAEKAGLSRFGSRKLIINSPQEVRPHRQQDAPGRFVRAFVRRERMHLTHQADLNCPN
jgi:hypothetical protein